MQISTKFTIAIHMLAATAYFGGDHKVTSALLADSVGTNPVIVRTIMRQLQDAGLLEVRRGPGGCRLARPLHDITFLDVYRAVETNADDGVFRFHESPNPQCPVGRNIHAALDGQLKEIRNDFEKDLAGRTLDEVCDVIESRAPHDSASHDSVA